MSAAYPVPAGEHRAEIEERRSRFIATVAPAADPDAAREFIERIRAEFADATHNCWAFLCGPPGTTTQIGMSDDGEPHGTAGRPMLNVLMHSGIGEVAAVVTRYYGGVKLGTGGLARAYGGAVQTALAELPIRERVSWVELTLRFDYPAVGGVQRLLAEHGAETDDETYSDVVVVVARVPAPRVDDFRRAVLDLTAGRGSVEPRDAV